MPVNFSGLFTGMDTNAIIQALVRVERQPIAALNQRKTAANQRSSTLGDLITKLKALQNETRNLDAASEVRAFSVSNSDETRVRVTAGAGATPGSYAITVNALASAQTSRSQSYASDTAGVAGTGSLEIAVGSGAPVAVDYDDTDSLTTIAARINGHVSGVSAYVLNSGSGFHLVVTGRSTGAAHAIAFTETGSGLGMTEQIAAADASITVNNMTITRPTNSFADVLAGLTVEARSVTPSGGAPTTVTVEADVEGQKAKVQKLVDSFNAVVSAINGQLGAAGRNRGESSLFGDSTLRGLQRRLSGVITTAIPHGGDTVSAGLAGISLNADGSLKLDGAKFTRFVQGDPAALESLLAATNGLSASLAAAAEEYAAIGTGHLVTKQKSIRTQVSDLDRQIARVESRASSLAESLQRQFNNLEQVTARMQTQSNYMLSLLVR